MNDKNQLHVEMLKTDSRLEEERYSFAKSPYGIDPDTIDHIQNEIFNKDLNSNRQI